MHKVAYNRRLLFVVVVIFLLTSVLLHVLGVNEGEECQHSISHLRKTSTPPAIPSRRNATLKKIKPTRKPNYNRRKIFLTKPIMTETFLSTARLKLYDSNVRNGTYKSDHPLLVLCTTFQPNLAKWIIHFNTIHSWGLLRPYLQPVLFAESLNDEMSYLLMRNGWKVLPIPKFREGLPVVSEMVVTAIKNFDAIYYGYANADILFDESLILTLLTLHNEKSKLDKFIIGRRVNYVLEVKDVVGSLGQIRTMATSGTIFMSQAMDYFISTKQGFPWSSIPQFVVGKRGYDNWIVIHASTLSLRTVDATNSILCLHQSDSNGDWEGRESKNAELNMNLIGNDSMFSGHTDCMRWETRLDHTHSAISVLKRNPNPCIEELTKDKIPVN